MWYDGPGHGRCIDLSNHPEHTQPAKVLSSFLPGQHLRKEGENDGHGTSYPARTRENGKVSGSEEDRALFFFLQLKKSKSDVASKIVI